MYGNNAVLQSRNEKLGGMFSYRMSSDVTGSGLGPQEQTLAATIYAFSF